MPKVARVLYNRLGAGQRLQLDSTVNYPLDLQALRTNADDRAKPGPYNSYAVAGLPPTPIAAPGKAAVEAALAPGRGAVAVLRALPDRRLVVLRGDARGAQPNVAEAVAQRRVLRHAALAGARPRGLTGRRSRAAAGVTATAVASVTTSAPRRRPRRARPAPGTGRPPPGGPPRPAAGRAAAAGDQHEVAEPAAVQHVRRRDHGDLGEHRRGVATCAAGEASANGGRRPAVGDVRGVAPAGAQHARDVARRTPPRSGAPGVRAPAKTSSTTTSARPRAAAASAGAGVGDPARRAQPVGGQRGVRTSSASAPSSSTTRWAEPGRVAAT